MKNLILLSLLLLSITSKAQPNCNWAYIPIGPAQTYNTIYNVTTDQNGNSIEVGKILGHADMDPSPNPADTAFTALSYNYYLSKTSIDGHLMWIRYFQNATQISFFEFKGLKINSANEIVVVGNFYGSVDFNLSASGVDTLRSHFPTYPDYFVAKYDSSGDYQWAFNIGDPTTSNIEVQAVTIMPNDNIVITANPNGIVDVDPGSSTHNSIGGNANLICYDTNGNYVWNNNIATVYSYGITNNSVDCEQSGNSYLATVGYYELTVNKFDNNGIRVWDKTIGDFSANSRVNPQSLLVDKATGDFYVAGTFGGTTDFDPGVAVVNRTSSSGSYQDGFIAKYNQNMDLLWVQIYAGNISFGDYSLDFDNSDIVAVGNFTGTIDFGNGIIFSSPTLFNPLYIKLDSNGITQNGFTIEGYGKYNTINICPNQSFVTTGYITSTTDMDPTSGSLVLNATASNFFNAVYQSTTTSINEFQHSDQVLLYPNPAKESLNLKVNDKVIGSTYNIYDYTGRLVMTGIITNETSVIKLDNLVSGIFLVSIEGYIKQTIKLIKE